MLREAECRPSMGVKDRQGMGAEGEKEKKRCQMRSDQVVGSPDLLIKQSGSYDGNVGQKHDRKGPLFAAS